ncbi:rr1 [Cnaphalocrocis medinalis granulovirus]|uniref:Rr1 n=1 Tax=Cnaphalocrocis medinalis granulovirus TaxID=1750712 RepID=A0A109WW86_9BBAC|nr:rr1 [Cnaphalocrocis medinalis granulovirus]AMF83845.1 rr1 [Cnaphalocrocis medinalis granulovirus]
MMCCGIPLPFNKSKALQELLNTLIINTSSSSSMLAQYNCDFILLLKVATKYVTKYTPMWSCVLYDLDECELPVDLIPKTDNSLHNHCMYISYMSMFYMLTVQPLSSSIVLCVTNITQNKLIIDYVNLGCKIASLVIYKKYNVKCIIFDKYDDDNSVACLVVVNQYVTNCILNKIDSVNVKIVKIFINRSM